MTHAHNGIIRGLNAIVQQAPYVPVATDEQFNSQDVADLLFFVKSWAKMVHHHHWVEESYMFPGIDKFTGRQGFMDHLRHQHDLFHDGMEALQEYASNTKPDDYRWEGPGGMKAIIDSFSKHLVDHLYAEVDVFLGMTDVDGAELKKIWAEAEKIAQQQGNLAMLVSRQPFGPPRQRKEAQDLMHDVFCSTTYSLRFLGAWTRHTRAVTTSLPCRGSCLTLSSTGSPRGTGPGASIRATGGVSRGHSHLDRQRTQGTDIVLPGEVK